jgi:predicted Zn finger-like uncharacterized protein
LWKCAADEDFPMKISCPTCLTGYELPDGSISATGRKVRCTECATVWLAMPDVPAFEAAPAPVSHAFDPVMSASEPEVALAPVPNLPVISAALVPAVIDPVPVPAVIEMAAPAAPEPAPDVPPKEDSADLDAWIAIASEQSEKPEGNDQNSVDSLFDDAPIEKEDDIHMASAADIVPAAANDLAIDAEVPAEADTLVVSPIARLRRGLINPHIGQFQPKKSKRTPAIAAGIAVFVALMMGAIAFRNSIVSVVPQMAGLYEAVGAEVNLRGIDIINIGSEITEADGIQVLVIKGEINNPSSSPRDIAPLFLAVLDENEKQVYGWSVMLEEKTIEPGVVLPFRRRLASPPSQGRKVMVRFYKEGDPKPAGAEGAGGAAAKEPVP